VRKSRCEAAVADARARLVWRLRALVRPPVTLGVRCLVIDAAGRVLLVRHTYTGGWHLPGGGVDPGETARQAAVRELREETGVALPTPPELFGLYWNEGLARRDHVALYVAPDRPVLDPAALRPRAAEIAEAVLAPLDAMPQTVTGPTRRRLEEVIGGAERSDLW
jgi:8-oxo-dGTP pyrophosphatase MutT (NUDIX family)